jgi:hypothetical protein
MSTPFFSRMQSALLTLVALVILTPAVADAQAIRGRVVNDSERAPIANAAVVVLNATGDVIARANTDASGFYRIALEAGGAYRISVAADGFQDMTQNVRIGAAGETLVPALVLKSGALALDTLEVTTARNPEALAGDWVEGFPVARAESRLAGARLADLERSGVTQYAAVRQLNGLRVRTVTRQGRRVECVESTRPLMGGDNRQGAQRGAAVARGGAGAAGGAAAQTPAEEACSPVVLIVDGAVAGDAFLLADLRLNNVESMEYLRPTEAGPRFGPDAAAFGAIVVWTRGRGPHRSAERDGSLR